MIDNPSKIKELGLSYLFHRAVADKEGARLSLSLLLDNAVGIGDHSTGDFHSNLDEALDKLVDAEDRLEVLEKTFGKRRTGQILNERANGTDK
tara:strand:+ start:1024 stop:1302 length:279 start_codon:yes stop_codon:yes gene_type:complete